MYYADMCGLKGKTRQWFGWVLIIGSDIAFASMTIFSFKRSFYSEYDQQPLVDVTMLLADFGLGAIMVILAMLLLWRIYDFMNEKGAWTEESSELELNRIEPIEAAAPKSPCAKALSFCGNHSALLLVVFFLLFAGLTLLLNLSFTRAIWLRKIN